MSSIGLGRLGKGDAIFSPRLIGGVIAIGVIAFIALLALMALGPQLSQGNDGGGHALSKAAPGYAGIVDLAERSGANVDLRRRVEPPRNGDATELVILAPTHRTRPEEMSELLKAQGKASILVVLPKWLAGRASGPSVKPGWVSAGFAASAPDRLLPPDRFGAVNISLGRNKPQSVKADFGSSGNFMLSLPAQAQTISGKNLDVLIAGPDGGAILARRHGSSLYVLADPDLINNLAFANGDKARGALQLVDAIAEDGNSDGLAFDLTLNGFGSQRSLLRFAFVPPFIGITLCLIAAGLLALWQAWARFGPALTPQRAIPISRAALIDNSADLIKQAKREIDGAGAYVKSLRTVIARRRHAPAGLDDAATDAWIDRLIAPGHELFSVLSWRLPLARNTHDMLTDAQALHQIRKDLLRDS